MPMQVVSGNSRIVRESVGPKISWYLYTFETHYKFFNSSRGWKSDTGTLHVLSLCTRPDITVHVM